MKVYGIANTAKTWKGKGKDESGEKKNNNKKSVSYIVYISNGWKIISDKAVNFFCPYKNTTIFFFFFKASL